MEGTPSTTSQQRYLTTGLYFKIKGHSDLKQMRSTHSVLSNCCQATQYEQSGTQKGRTTVYALSQAGISKAEHSKTPKTPSPLGPMKNTLPAKSPGDKAWRHQKYHKATASLGFSVTFKVTLVQKIKKYLWQALFNPKHKIREEKSCFQCHHFRRVLCKAHTRPCPYQRRQMPN